jgi:hypothetical protein
MSCQSSSGDRAYSTGQQCVALVGERRCSIVRCEGGRRVPFRPARSAHRHAPTRTFVIAEHTMSDWSSGSTWLAFWKSSTSSRAAGGLCDVGRPQTTHAVGRSTDKGPGYVTGVSAEGLRFRRHGSGFRYRALRTCGWVSPPPEGPNTLRDAATRASPLADGFGAAGHTRVIAAASRAGANECDEVYFIGWVQTALPLAPSPSSRHLLGDANHVARGFAPRSIA